MTAAWVRPPSRAARALGPLAALSALFLGGCAHQLPQAGPSTAAIVKSSTAKRPNADYVVIDLTSRVAAGLPHPADPSLRAVFGDTSDEGESIIKAGDYLSVSLWEASSTVSLLGAGGTPEATSGAMAASREAIPEQMVSPLDGSIVIPFAGRVHVAGLRIDEANDAVRAALHGIATNPQVIVGLTRNTSNQALVVGDDVKSVSYTLTPNQDRIMDAVAAAGGVASPAYQAQVRLTRGGRSVTIGLQKLLSNPSENIHLHPHDVLAVLKNPEFFTMLGAVGKDSQIQFQNDRMSLAEALGNGGGLIDERADPSGVFLFRFEPKARVQALCPTCNVANLGDIVPVVYRLNMRHADAFFVAQTVQVLNRDVVFVSNAPEVQVAKIFALTRDAFQPVIAAGVLARDVQQ